MTPALGETLPLVRIVARAEHHTWSKTSAGSTLIHLPLEILSLIVQRMDRSTLRKFATINSDCRWLARPGLFSTVKVVGPTRESMNILRALILAQTEPRIRDCLTYLHIHVGIRPETGWRSTLPQIGVSACIASCPALASLTLIGTRSSSIVLGKVLFRTILKSNLKHLQLVHCRGDRKASYMSLALDDWPCQLQTIDARFVSVELNRNTGGSREIGWISSLIWACCTTIRNLHVHSSRERLVNPEHESEKLACCGQGIGKRKTFKLPALHKVALDCSEDLLELYTHAKQLAELNILPHNQKQCAAVLRTCKEIPNLSALACIQLDEDYCDLCNFLQGNPQLVRLNVVCNYHTTLGVLRLLEEHGQSIVSLTLESSKLGMPGGVTLKSLRQLCLDAYTWVRLHAYAWSSKDRFEYHTWMRNYFEGCTTLEVLAFSRELMTYDDMNFIQELISEFGSFAGNEEAWLAYTTYRAQYALEEAERYAKVFPRLRWIYISQMPIAIENGKATMDLKYHLLDDDLYLKELFGIANSEFPTSSEMD